jgi:sugar O-acyltransferase (sialic acid O-acetyltransferase NeuD family)
MDSLIIYGAGGLGREIRWLAESLGTFSLAGFCDDQISPGTSVEGLPILGGIDHLRKLCEQSKRPVHVVVAIGNPLVKAEIVSNIETFHRINFPSLISPKAVLSNPDFVLGAGAIITAGCILTTGIRLGEHVLLNLNCTVGHDVSIGSFTSVMPGCNLAGEVSIGEKCLIGMGVNIINRRSIGNNTIVGAGSLVIRDIPGHVTVIGVPTRLIRHGSK